MRWICLVFLLNVFGTYSLALDNYKFRLLDVSEGLSDDQIRSLSMVPDGRMAIRTASILNIYNGSTFRHYYYDKVRKYEWNYSRPPKEYYDNEGRMWLKELHYLLLLDLSTNEFEYDIPGVLKTMGIHEKLANMFIDNDKNYWFVTESGHFYLYDIKKKILCPIGSERENRVRHYGVPVELAQYKNQCWIVYSSGLIRCWDYSAGEFISEESRFVGLVNGFADRIYLKPDIHGNLWFMYNNGVFYYNRMSRLWKTVVQINDVSNFFTCMDIDRKGDVWVGTSKSGLRLIRHQTFNVEKMDQLELTDGGSLDNDIYSVFVDEDNGLWVGTLFQGLCYYHPAMHKFNSGHVEPGVSEISNESTRSMVEDPDGNVLIGNKYGVYRFDRHSKRNERIFSSQINGLCLSLYYDRENSLWVGTYYDGFYRIRQGEVRQYLCSPDQTRQPERNIARAILEDEKGRFWVSVTGGVGQMDPETGKLLYFLSDKHPELKRHKLVYSLKVYKPGVFLALGDNGAFFYDTDKDRVWFRPDISYNGRRLVSDAKCFSYLKDKRHLEWYGTEDGIGILDSDGKAVGILTVENGLPNNAISAMIEDKNGDIWASTFSGVCKIGINHENTGDYTFTVVKYDVSDGLLRGKFYENTVLKTHDGEIFFGGAHGFNYFNPEKINYDTTTHVPVFTGFYVFNKPVSVNKSLDGYPCWTMTDSIQTVTLKYNQNTFSIDFSGLNYVNPSHTYYRYKLEGFDKDWTEISSSGLGRAVYTGLRPGEYKFSVYTANSDKIWGKTPAVLSVVIKPPFWLTSFAVTLYVLVCLALLGWAVRRWKKVNRIKAEKEKEKLERQQREELDQMKFHFFTNISHEFRTPLALIMTPLGILIKEECDAEKKQRLGFIYQNADKLLKLVNQLLDFRKIEMKREVLSLKMGDMVGFVEDLYGRFKEMAAARHINFDFKVGESHLYMNFDPDKMYKIISNLLSNAFKFTPDDGYIVIEVDKECMDGREYALISVRDTGCGIDPKNFGQIFDRFYQAMDKGDAKLNNGSGIGLYLVKEYATLHDGKVTVESDPGKGTVFTVYVPTDLKGQPEAEDAPLSSGEEMHEWNDENNVHETQLKKKILVVEDNKDFRLFLVSQLNKEFEVMEASDGAEGEEKAIAENPDIIVSDLMMPQVDGMELCRRIKHNIKTSHIPFILLTARSSDSVQVEGYEAGIDSYISKPFNFDILLVRIRKLIEQQEKRKELFHKTIVISPSTITTTSLDEDLVKRALVSVEKNMDNADYTIEDLGRDLGLSRAHLNRKLQSIVELTPLQFIRSIRLKRAAQLLQDSQYNVAEIADMVGFNTLRYFNKYFKDEFHMTPTQYREEHKNKA